MTAFWRQTLVGKKFNHIKRIFALSPSRFLTERREWKEISFISHISRRQRAKYFDPVTQLPYATLQAFRILREAYCQQLEVKGDANDAEIGRWIEWRQKYRQARLAALAAARAQQANAQCLTTSSTTTTSQIQPTQPQQPAPAVVKPTNNWIYFSKVINAPIL